MRSIKDLHLDEDLLLKAVVDKADLPRSRREHLARCTECRKRKKAIAEDLARLGQRAEQLCPSPRRRISPAPEKSRTPWSWQWRTAIGAAVAALVIGVVVMPGLFRVPQGLDDPIPAQDLLEAEAFMIEISLLAENALPEEYLEITGESDDQPDEDLEEGFLEFMAPAMGPESWSCDWRRKGGKRC